MANEVAAAFNDAWRDYVIDGVPSSGANKPLKSEIRGIGTVIQTTVDGLDTRLDVVEGAIGGLPAEVDALDTRVDEVEALALAGVKPAKQSVRLLMTTDVVIASALENGDPLDGLTLVTGDRVALTGQTTGSQNGVYVVAISGTAARSADLDTADELVGARFDVDAGTHAAETWAMQTTAPITVGTTVLTFVRTTSANAINSTVAALAVRIDQSDAKAEIVAMLEGLSVPTARLTEAAGSVSPSVYRSYSFVAGDTIEHLVVAKAAERGSLQLTHGGAGAAYTANFNLEESAVSSTSGANLVSAAITDLGSGWYECKAVVLVAANVTNNVQARMSASGALPYTGDGTSGMYVRSIVLRKQGLTANLFPSSDPANAAFTKQNVTVTTTTSPHEPALVTLPPLVDELDVIVNGRMTASKVVEPGVSGSPSIYQAKSVVAGNLIVWEVTTKRAERKRLNLFSNSAALIDCTFDLELGTVAQGGAAVTGSSCTALGNGWYRCRVEATATASASSNWQHRIFKDTGTQPYVGDGVSGLYIQRSSFSLNGGPNVFGSAEDLSTTGWTKSAGLTVVADAALYLGLLADPTNLGGDPYDDGSAALVGKKWTALGSSITIGAYYAALLAGQTGMVLTNLGVSGSALGLSTTGYASYGMSAPIATMPTDAEIVTLEPGPNAFGAQETPLGAFGDTTYATHYGSIWKAILDIRTRAPSAKIIVFGVYSGGPGHATHRLGRTNGQGNTMDQFMKAEREVCQALGVRYIDISQSGIGYMTSTLYMSDELHPNAAGSLRYATYGAGSLRDMVRRGLFVN
ncbi:SGNH/GDSL hydrolase family protein [Mesorhizobium sp. M0130]|uniref:SGNH/GDSL hydrolase family protein n=1 Tax=Mesorhizobium sp. M0130 TaxID=2956887 RepID=UPI00333DC3BE